MENLRIGVINWDCAAPADTFFGHHTSRVLSPKQFRTRTPYYAHIEGPEKISYTYKTQQEFDRELAYAAEAGIDYFAYTWYTEEKLPRDDIEGKLHEITHARKMHLQSAWKDRIHLCALFVCSHIHTDGDLEKLAAEMKQPYYEKVEGRPLVYLMGGYRPDYIERLNALCKKHGLPAPYLVFFHSTPELEAEDDSTDYSGASAVSKYSCAAKGVTTPAQFYDRLLYENERRKKFGIDVVPLFSMGWDPTPRIVNPVPWTKYPAVDYAPYASREELLEGARRLCDWIKANPERTAHRHILTFAWNEFEEGGHICPTYNEDLTVNEERIGIFREISRLFKSEL